MCMVPMVVDGSLQTFFGIMSTNFRRSLTGGLFGFGLGSIIGDMYRYLDTRT